MRIKQPKMLFPAGKERRPPQEIPSEADRIKARLARMPAKPQKDKDKAPAKADSKSHD
jgi:hypothetical protein